MKMDMKMDNRSSTGSNRLPKLKSKRSEPKRNGKEKERTKIVKYLKKWVSNEVKRIYTALFTKKQRKKDNMKTLKKEEMIKRIVDEYCPRNNINTIRELCEKIGEPYISSSKKRKNGSTETESKLLETIKDLKRQNEKNEKKWEDRLQKLEQKNDAREKKHEENEKNRRHEDKQFKRNQQQQINAMQKRTQKW